MFALNMYLCFQLLFCFLHRTASVRLGGFASIFHRRLGLPAFWCIPTNLDVFVSRYGLPPSLSQLVPYAQKVAT